MNLMRTLAWSPAVVLTVLGLVACSKAPSLPAAATAASAPRLVLDTQDVIAVRSRSLTQGVEVTGQIQAVQTAWVKAKTAGELQQLSVREGDPVRAGQVIGQIDPMEAELRLRQAQQQADASRAQLDVAERALANSRALVSQGFISPTALDTSVANANSARAALQVALAAIDLARKARDDTRLVAPISGQVAQRLVQVGERLPVDAKVLEIVDLSRLELQAAVPPQQVTQLRAGATAVLQVDGLADPVPARVARVNPSASAGTRTVLAYLSVTPHPALRQGLFARGRVDLGQVSALAVPTSAIRIDQPKPYVLVLRDDQVAAQAVQTGLTGWVDGLAVTQIVQGLQAGDVILAGRVGSVPQGTRVQRPAAPAAAASAG